MRTLISAVRTLVRSLDVFAPNYLLMKLAVAFARKPRLAVFLFAFCLTFFFKTEASLLPEAREVDAGTPEMTAVAPFDHISEQFAKIPSPPLVKHTVSGETPGTPSQELCFIEIQVSRKVPGRCIQLGRTARGCVAGRDIRLFHKECM